MAKSKGPSDDTIKSFLGCGALLLVVLVVCGGFGASALGGVYQDYSDGERVGTVYKISKRGLFAKPYEGTLLLSDFRGNDKDNGWDFSCQDEATGKKIADLAGKKVKLTYRQWMIRPWYQSTPYTVTAVEEVK